MKTRRFIAGILTLTLTGCTVGPNYKRPSAEVPAQYRGIVPGSKDQSANPAFAEMKWQSVFQDEVLQGLIKEALTNNYDFRIAASRIVQAEASVGIERANQIPALSGSFGIENNRIPGTRVAPTFYAGALTVSYVFD